MCKEEEHKSREKVIKVLKTGFVLEIVKLNSIEYVNESRLPPRTALTSFASVKRSIDSV